MKTGMSTRARLCIREVARELEEDMELGDEGDLNAAAPSTASFPPPCSLSLSRRGHHRALCRRGHRLFRPLI